MLIGLQTFAEVAVRDGVPESHPQTLHNTIESAVFAESVGIDAFTIGEHHRVDYPVPNPEMLLSAIATRTSKIRLGSAVTVLSTDDPVRVYERFAMLDGISGGRAEPMLGRGSFTETFGLYGFDLSDYERLFEERLQLWSLLRSESAVNWSGQTRPPLTDAHVYPHSATPGGLTTWVGVGGNPQSVIRAASYGFNLMLSGLGMTVERITQYTDLFDRALEHYGHPRPLVGVSVTGHLADTDRDARDQAWGPYEERMSKMSKERGFSVPSRASFEASIDQSLNFVGSPTTVLDRVRDLAARTGVDRIDFGMDTGGLPVEVKHRSIELLGNGVSQLVKTDSALAPERV